MNSKLLLSLLIMAVIGLTGCSEEKVIPNKQPEPVKELAAEVKEVKVNEAPSEASTPAEAAMSQYEVIFDNGDSKFPTEESLITESTIGDNSVLAIHSPEGKNHYAVFVYGFDNEWFIEGVIRLAYLEEEAYIDKAGLALPMTRFNTANIKIGEGKEVWAFVNDEKLATISRYDRFEFEVEETEQFSLKNGIEAFITVDQFNNQFLYYFDTEKIITVSGNLSKEELVDLANSLASAHSAYFPSSVR